MKTLANILLILSIFSSCGWTEKQKKTSGNYRKSTNSYMKYSGMAFQMGIIILIGVFVGKKVDAWLNTEPYLMVLFALLSVFAALYIVLKDLIRNKE